MRVDIGHKQRAAYFFGEVLDWMKIILIILLIAPIIAVAGVIVILLILNIAFWTIPLSFLSSDKINHGREGTDSSGP